MKNWTALLLLVLAWPLPAQPLNPQITQLIKHPVLEGALWSGYAAYADNGEEVFSIQPDLRMTPASTLKLLTTAAALDVFGPYHRFETFIYADSEPDNNGTLNGNLYIQGGGDPTLGSSRVQGSLAMDDLIDLWVQKIKNAGIKKINGRIYGDASAFEGPSVPIKTNWENMGNYFAAPASALSINDNTLRIYFKPQPLHNAPVTLSHTVPQLDGLNIVSHVKTDAKNRKDNAFVYGAPNQYDMEIYGTIPDNLMGFSIDAAMPDPALFTVNYLKEKLEQNGVTVDGAGVVLTQTPNYEQKQLIYTHLSPELKDIIYIVNKRSFNFYAEMLLRQLALKAGQKGSIDNGVLELERFLKRNALRTDNIKIYDGSGLSRDNMVTARTLAQTLSLMPSRPEFKYYDASLATPEDRGDLLVLRRLLSPAKRTGDIHLKGGTIDGVKAFAGYVKDRNGRLISFAFMANNLVSKDEALFRIHENILKLLLAQPQPVAAPTTPTPVQTQP